MSVVTATEDITPATQLFKHYLRVLRRRWILVTLLCVGVVAAAALAVRLWNPPYNARAVVQVPTTWTGSLADVRLDIGYTERLLNTYVALSASGRLNGRVAERLPELDTSSLTINLDIPANTELLISQASATTPELAATGANAAAEMLVEELQGDLNSRFTAASESLTDQIEVLDRRLADLPEDDDSAFGLRNELLGQREVLQRDLNQVRALSQAASSGVTIVETAELPSARPSVTRLIGLAAIVGLAGAVLLVIVIDRLDETVFDVDEITTQRGYTVLGEVVMGESQRGPNRSNAGSPLAIDPTAVSLAYRLKAASPRTLMTTSVHWDPATVSYVAELCRALASTGLRLVVVDTAVSPTRLATLLGAHGDGTDVGLPGHDANPTVAAGVTKLTANDNLHMASVRWAVDFIGMSDYPRKALDRLESDYDVVVVFVPGLLDRAEASLLGKAVEGTLLVIGEGAVSENDLQASFRQIESLPSRFLGVVVGKHRTRRPVH